MAVKAVFLDFYGTLVHEDGPVVDAVLHDICAQADGITPGQALGCWWKYFASLLRQANEGPFRDQFTLAREAFRQTLAQFGAPGDADALCRRMIGHWSDPQLYGDSRAFLAGLPVPYYLVTNGDSVFLETAAARLDLHPAGLISSEQAKAYKPDPRIFRAALRQANAAPDEVLFIGDSLDTDIRAAHALGIGGVWLDRAGKGGAPDVRSAVSLRDITLPEL